MLSNPDGYIHSYRLLGTISISLVASSKPNIIFIDCTALPTSPFIKLSKAEITPILPLSASTKNPTSQKLDPRTYLTSGRLPGPPVFFCPYSYKLFISVSFSEHFPELLLFYSSIRENMTNTLNSSHHWNSKH